MKKIFILVFAALIISASSFAQDIKPVKSVNDLKEIRKGIEGKVVLINFWASWCKPCVHEFPDLVKLYKNYKDKGFVLVFISLDMPEEINGKVKPILNKNSVDFTTYYSDFKNPEDLINYFDTKWEGAIPSTYIYDKNGKLVNNFIGNQDYEYFVSEIEKLVN